VLRTVTFSNPDVAELVNANFVAAWYNRSPGFHNLTHEAEKNIFTSSVDAYPTKNICTFFLTPDGKVFHYVAGHLGPSQFLEVLRLAIKLRAEAFDEAMALRPKGMQSLRAIHAERARWLLANPLAIEEGALTYRGRTHTHSLSCQWALEGLRFYLRGLHSTWAETAELPALGSIRYDYLYGNSFTQELPGTPPIKGRELTRRGG
jgi:hypothetical protein